MKAYPGHPLIFPNKKKKVIFSAILLLLITLLFSSCETSSPNSSVSNSTGFTQSDFGDSEQELEKGRSLFEEESYEGAIVHLNKIIDRHKGATEGLLSMGVMAGSGRGNKTAAQGLAVEARATGIIMVQSYLIRGQAYLKLKRYELAMKDFKAVIELAPTLPSGYYYCGITYLQMDNLEKALEAIRMARSISPDLPEVHNGMGVIYLEMGQPERAEKSFSNALMIRSHFSDALGGRARAKWELGKKRSALRDLTLAISLSDQSLHLAQRGWFRAGMGEFEPGMEDLTASLEKAKPGDKELIFMQRGWLNYTHDNLELAEQDFEATVAAVADDEIHRPHYANLLLAIARFRLNSHSKAIQGLSHYLNILSQHELDEESEKIWFTYLGELFLNRKTENDIFNAVDEADPEFQERFFLEGTFYVAQKYLIEGDLETAVSYLKEIRKLRKTNDFEYQASLWQLKTLEHY